MRYTQLRSFHLVASAKGFNAAAEAFNISQPTLTAQIGALEDEFGIELFVKRGRRRELSDAGRQLFSITTRLFAEEAEALAFLSESRELRTGRLSISAVGPFHVTEMLAAFNQAHPGIELAVKLGNSAEVLDDLASYRCDVAVLAYIDEDDRLLTIPYRRHPVALFVRDDHRLAGRGSIRLSDLEGEPMIVREQGSTTRRAFERALAKTSAKPRLMMEIGSREAIREAVIRGLGISYVSEAEFVPHDNLKLIPIEEAEVYTYAHVVLLKQRETTRIIRAFLDVVYRTRDAFGVVQDQAELSPPLHRPSPAKN